MEDSSQDYGMGDKTFITYSLGFFLCIILTLIPYAAVKWGNFSYGKTLAHIYIPAVVQAIIQIVFFLHLNFRTKQAKMNVMGFVYILTIGTVVVCGSLWIMWNLNHNMM